MNRSAAGRMIRKQVYLTPEQDRALKQHAKELGVTEAQIIRASLGRTLRLDAAAAAQATWEEELAFMRDRAKIAAPQTSRAWTREELYDRAERGRAD